jgi:hypothetical protein
MKYVLFALATAGVVVSARAEPIADNDRARAAIVQAEQQRALDRAREKCLANRGTDCDTVAGLQEWLLLDRSRAEAVLDRVAPLGSSSAGASVPPAPSGSSAGGGLSPRYP